MAPGEASASPVFDTTTLVGPDGAGPFFVSLSRPRRTMTATTAMRPLLKKMEWRK